MNKINSLMTIIPIKLSHYLHIWIIVSGANLWSRIGQPKWSAKNSVKWFGSFFFPDKVMLDAEMGPLSIYVNFRIIEKHGTFIGNSIIWGVYGHVLCLAQKELVHGWKRCWKVVGLVGVIIYWVVVDRLFSSLSQICSLNDNDNVLLICVGYLL